jgi:hypothetical protein
VEEISTRAQQLVQKWGQENIPPPAHIYSLGNSQGSGLHVIQKTFIGDFEVKPSTSRLISSLTSSTTRSHLPRK